LSKIIPNELPSTQDVSIRLWHCDTELMAFVIQLSEIFNTFPAFMQKFKFQKICYIKKLTHFHIIAHYSGNY